MPVQRQSSIPLVIGVTFLLSAVVVLITAYAGQPTDALVVDSLNRDLGLIPNGSEQQVRFSIANAYTVPVEITQLIGHCTCASVRVSKKTIRPGESAVLTTTISYAGSTGRLVREIEAIYIVKDEMQARSLTFSIEANVFEPEKSLEGEQVK